MTKSICDGSDSNDSNANLEKKLKDRLACLQVIDSRCELFGMWGWAFVFSVLVVWVIHWVMYGSPPPPGYNFLISIIVTMALLFAAPVVTFLAIKWGTKLVVKRMSQRISDQLNGYILSRNREINEANHKMVVELEVAKRESAAASKKKKEEWRERQSLIKKRQKSLLQDLEQLLSKSGADDPVEIIKLHDAGYYKWDLQGQCWCVDEALFSNEKKLSKLEKEFGINIDW